MNIVEAIEKLESSGLMMRVQKYRNRQTILGGSQIRTINPDAEWPMIQIEDPFFIYEDEGKWVVEFEDLIPSVLIVKVSRKLEEAVRATINYAQFRQRTNPRWLTSFLIRLNFRGVIVNVQSENTLQLNVTDLSSMSDVHEYMEMIINQEMYIPTSTSVYLEADDHQWRLKIENTAIKMFPMDESEKTRDEMIEWVTGLRLNK